MKRRHWIKTALVAGCGASCGKRGDKAAAPSASVPASEPTWQPLADYWEHAMGGEFTRLEPGILRIQWGESLSAIRWSGNPVTLPFEVEWEARRLDGSDFFSGLTFPARESGEALTWVVGGWGGALVGISSIDGKDAAANETTRHQAFEKGRWYRLRLRREGERLTAWIDGEPVIDLDTSGRELGLRAGPIDCCAPFGLATWQTTGEFRGLRWRDLRG
jgi:hypothetical protein